MAKETRKQGIRLIFLLLYVAILFVVNWLAFDLWVPSTGSKGLWFYASAANIILGNLLVTPFYTKPVDALSYSLFAGTGVYLVNDISHWYQLDLITFWLALSFLVFVLIISLITISTADSQTSWVKKVSQTCMILSDFLGNHKVIFSVVFFFALILFHRESTKEMLLLILSWALIVVIEPDKHIWHLILKIKGIWLSKLYSNELGTIEAYQSPKIILIRKHENINIAFGQIMAYKDSLTSGNLAVALNYVGRDNELLLRALDLTISDEYKNVIYSALQKSKVNTVINYNILDEKLKELKELQNSGAIIGIVDENTNVERLEFEVIKEEHLSEGRLVEVDIRGVPVMYQIIDGLTIEDIVAMKNKYGYARAKASKIGTWDEKDKKFKLVKWLPDMNTPVYLKEINTTDLDVDAIGCFPQSNFHVYIKNIHELVTHNTAILGILGIGKSMLSIDLVERMINERIKVVCIDLTDQYATELKDFFDIEWSNQCLTEIQEAGQKDKDTFEDSPTKGGSIVNLKEAIENDINDFINNDKDHFLKIYNPSEFFATKQLNDPKQYKDNRGEWQRSAPLWELTPVEITSIITESVLKYVKGTTSKEARVCLIFEEAHSLVPEWGNISDDGDKAATNRTARAILQGRKYGMGCLLITQRTANVTKTILNQCNTIFAMRTFDDTGKTFMANYIGNEYTNKLSSLEPEQAVFFGKASSCENPVLIQLNHRDKEFLKAFRK
ncbi:MAG: DUF87 domain-containing protein, partial [Flavobacteriales bacterium]|nr:DUF87 domain-containing protein [Flavobacteriales bacterium]